ncbi:MAG: carboxypeptidase-like regulatory domain-containing protein [Bryobacterales bacterium]
MREPRRLRNSKSRVFATASSGVVFLLLSCGALFAQQPPGALPTSPETAIEEAATGQIAGTVISAKTGEILKGVEVMTRGMVPGGRGPSPPVIRETIAGIDGRFVLTDLPPAEYDLIASKAGYGGQYAFNSASRIRLAADEQRTDVVLRLQPSAVVTGRVLDAYGEPLPEAQVQALTRRALPGRATRWMTVQGARTNDLGEYRLHGLDAGKYVIAAQAPRAASPRGVAYAEFAPSYYPGAVSLDQASPIRLTYGAEMNGVDFQLDRSPETTVRGIVIDGSTGEACTCSLRFGDDEVMGRFDFGTQTTKEGVFVVHGLQPGTRSIMANLDRGGAPRFHSEQIQVPESGDLEVRIAIGGSYAVSGEFVLEDPPEQKPAEQSQSGGAQQQNATPDPQRPIMFALESLGPFPFPGGRGTVPPQGGSFEIGEVQSGEYRIRVYGMPAGGYLRLVTLDGRELSAPRITVPRDGPLTGLKLYAAFDGASIQGMVKPAAGEETRDVSGGQFVMAVPDGDLNAYAEQSMTRLEPGGGFTFQTLAPGSYILFVANSPTIDISDPDIRRALKPYSKQVSLAKKEQARVELTAAPESVELW